MHACMHQKQHVPQCNMPYMRARAKHSRPFAKHSCPFAKRRDKPCVFRLRHGAYTGTASIALDKQLSRTEKAHHGITLSAPTSREGGGGLPKIKGVSGDGYAALSGAGLRPGDEVVMITRKDGTCSDLRSFARPAPPPRGASSQPPNAKGLEIQAKLGHWRQVMSPTHGAFFSHAVSGQRHWKIPDGPSEVTKMLTEELDTDNSYP